MGFTWPPPRVLLGLEVREFGHGCVVEFLGCSMAL